MKRIFALVLVITLAFSLIGCTPKVKADNKNGTNPENENIMQDKPNEVMSVSPVIDVSYPEMTPYPDESNVTDWNEFYKQYSEWAADRNTQRNFQGRVEGVVHTHGAYKFYKDLEISTGDMDYTERASKFGIKYAVLYAEASSDEELERVNALFKNPNKAIPSFTLYLWNPYYELRKYATYGQYNKDYNIDISDKFENQE